MGDTYTLTKRIIERNPDNPYPLGRNVNHDSRSRNFAFEAPEKVTLVTTYHKRYAPVFDQGNIGSCVPNAGLGALGTEPFLPRTDIKYDEDEARNLYTQVTASDGYPGQWPPDDTGSDGLSIAKLFKSLGWISGFQHAFSLDATLAALQSFPVLLGIPWYDSMFDVSPEGEVSITASAQVAGGHEIEAFGVDVDAKRVWFYNSWGTAWGVNGRGFFSFDTLSRLLSEQGDATVLLPLSVPAPTPTPAPVPTPVPPAPSADPNDVSFAKVLKKGFIGRFFYKSVQTAAKEWIAKKNL